MTRIWQLLTSELGSAFRNQYGDVKDTTFRYWSNELREFSEQQLLKGLESFKKSRSTYMSLNIFRNHCMPSPEEHGIDSFEQSYSRIQARAWEELHPAFMHVANKTVTVKVVVKNDKQGNVIKKDQLRLVYDLRSLKHGDEFTSRRVAKEIYEEVVKRVVAGEHFEPVMLLEGRRARKYIVPELDLDMNGPRGNEAMKGLLQSMGSEKANVR